MGKKNSETTIAVRTTFDLKRRVERKADSMEISVASLIRIALAEYLNKEEK